MLKIMLACAQGVSTSLLVTKMVQAAEEKGTEAEIWAVDYSSVEDRLGTFDVLLLGPQISYAFDEIKEIVGDKAPVEVIKAQDYGRCNGKAVLEFALQLWEERN